VTRSTCSPSLAQTFAGLDDLIAKTLTESNVRGPDAPLMSPYAFDEAVDHDALHALHSKRRAGMSTPRHIATASPTSILFRPDEDEDAKESAPQGWIETVKSFVSM
jgi:hypothetical protein